MSEQPVPICPECKSDHVRLDNLGGYRCPDCEYRWPESNQQEPVKRYDFTAFPTHVVPSAFHCEAGPWVAFAAYDQDTEKLRAENVRLMSLLSEWFDAFGANCTGLSLADLRRRTLLEDGHE